MESFHCGIVQLLKCESLEIGKMEYQFGFEKLDVWKKSKDLVIDIYIITQKFPKEEVYGLVSQVRRASVSVASNLAEGTSRTSQKDKAHFTSLAYGSLMELLNQLIIAFELHYINTEDLKSFRNKISEISNKLNSLRKQQLSISPSKQCNSITIQRLNSLTKDNI